MIKTKSVQATMMLPARFFLLYSSYLLFILQPFYYSSYSHAPNLALGNGAAK